MSLFLDSVFSYWQCVKDLAANQTRRKNKSHKVLYGSYNVFFELTII